MKIRAVTALCFVAQLLGAQTVQVVSEFRRVDAKGMVIAQDAPGKPREILSPGLARNAYHTMRVIVRPPKPGSYAILLARNPEDSGTMKFYRELPATPASGVPDKLQLVKVPYVFEAGQEALTFLLDVWTPAESVVQRVRIEVQLNDGEGWVIYPMEARVLSAIVPKTKPRSVLLPPPPVSTEASARLAMREYLCGDSPATVPPSTTIRSLLYRNAQQDMALARALQLRLTKPKLADMIAKAAGAENADFWCKTPPPTTPIDPEWYLRVRDLLYKESSR